MHEVLGDLPLPGRDGIDPGVARLWAAIVALDLPERSKAPVGLSARQRCALHRI